MWMKLICLVIMFMAIPGIKGEIPLAFTPAAISGGQNDTSLSRTMIPVQS